MLTMASTQIDRGRCPPALPTPQLGQHMGERPIDNLASRIDVVDGGRAAGAPQQAISKNG